MRNEMVAITASILLFCAIDGGSAQQQQQAPSSQAPSSSAIAGSEYKPLTFWKQIKIGSAYYTNPKYIKKLSYAYSFDAKDITSSPDEKVGASLMGASASPALVDPATGVAKVIPADEWNNKTWGELLADSKKSGEKIVVLSAENSLLGKKSTEPWVADFK